MIHMHARFVHVLCRAATVAGVLAIYPVVARADDGQGGHEFTVRCDKGKTIGDALDAHQGPVTLKIVGVCDEHVVVNRNDVSLIAGAPGAGIDGPDRNTNTLQVTGDRFVLDGLTVTGGRNAIVVSGGGRATLSNCTARGTGTGIIGGIGIIFFQGANGTVDHCTVSGNAADGLLLDAAIATIVNSTFSGNGRAGILVFHGSTARIGMTNGFTVAPNTISGNGSAGIHVTLNSLALIVGNTITGNGTNPAGPFGRSGITVFMSRADLPGGNTITNNFGQGVLVGGASTVVIGDPGFGFPTRNTIRGNSTAGTSQGISVALNSTLGLRDALVEANNGAGVALTARSIVNVVSSTITGNTANGIQLSQGSAAIFQPNLPISSLSGNAGTDLKCLDGESSFTGPIAAGATIDCTGF
ncbi:MAG TPA: right-handed parallel beta-helix repeat-containing protein [Methylomirabilota bacterium]|nr:right-handed parallel beta-helix repeat-containing protein [Methylomirabilota bacterium]